MNRTYKEAAEYLRSHDHYTIITHRRPDGDTIGSAAALCAGLRSLGKQAAVLENPQVTPRYAPLLAGMTCAEPQGTVVSVDVASPAMFPQNYSGAVDYAIDHHGSNPFFAGETCVEAGTAACGEIICRILQELDCEITPAMANALYVAISTDTGCFRYSNTTPATLRTTAQLMEWGADTAELNHSIFEVKSPARLALEAHLTANLRLYAGGIIGFCYLSLADKARMNVTEDDADAIAGFARNLEGVQIGGMIRELENGQGKVSLRTDNRRWDASRICKRLGGGGHSAAAGATVCGSMEDTAKAVLKAIEEEYGLKPEGQE